MTLRVQLAPLISLAAGIGILVFPKLLNYIVAGISSCWVCSDSPGTVSRMLSRPGGLLFPGVRRGA